MCVGRVLGDILTSQFAARFPLYNHYKCGLLRNFTRACVTAVFDVEIFSKVNSLPDFLYEITIKVAFERLINVRVPDSQSVYVDIFLVYGI